MKRVLPASSALIGFVNVLHLSFLVIAITAVTSGGKKRLRAAIKPLDVHFGKALCLLEANGTRVVPYPGLTPALFPSALAPCSSFC